MQPSNAKLFDKPKFLVKDKTYYEFVVLCEIKSTLRSSYKKKSGRESDAASESSDMSSPERQETTTTTAPPAPEQEKTTKISNESQKNNRLDHESMPVAKPPSPVASVDPPSKPGYNIDPKLVVQLSTTIAKNGEYYPVKDISMQFLLDSDKAILRYTVNRFVTEALAPEDIFEAYKLACKLKIRLVTNPMIKYVNRITPKTKSTFRIASSTHRRTFGMIDASRKTSKDPEMGLQRANAALTSVLEESIKEMEVDIDAANSSA
jgi:hypothetical protein